VLSISSPSYLLRYAPEIVGEIVRVVVVTAAVAVIGIVVPVMAVVAVVVLVGAVVRVVPVPVMSMMVAFMMFRQLCAMALTYCATVDNECCLS
jgi:hypothetical protein